ncbi:MAG: patatin-like phospholipase family protein [Bryobacteraceae bacterium]
MIFRKSSVLLVTLACLCSLAAEPPATQRKRIGLVLEGGGALGFAHIGVLAWMEQNRIPVDVITGTSMGGLVGGLYAAGKSPEEIKTLVQDIDWHTVLAGQIEFQDLSYRRKEDRLAYPNRLEFGIRNGFGGPSGLNSGQAVDGILAGTLLPYFELASFDDLPIPFRCVATDMTSGTQKVFDRGSLAQALRATMSIPAIFSPAKGTGGALYTDGGALNNLPVDVAKRMGVDIVIAVMLDLGPPDPKAMGSPLGIAGRTISIMISANEKRNIELADILLNADLKGFTATDFTESAAIIPKGFEAADRKKALLSTFTLSPEEWTLYTAKRDARRRTDVPKPEFVTVTGTSPAEARRIEKKFSAAVGKAVDTEGLDRQLSLLAGEGPLSNLRYGMVRKDGRDGLEINAAEKSYGPPFLNIGVLIDGSDSSDVRFGLAARLTLFNVGSFGTEWRTDASFGTNYGANTEYFRPLGENGWFVAPRAGISRSKFDVYNSDSRIADYSVIRANGGVDIGHLIGRKAEIRVGQDVIFTDATLKIGTPIAPNTSKTYGDTSVRFQYLGQDDAMLPRAGFVNLSRFDWLTSGPVGGGYPSLQTQWLYFKRVSARGSLFIGGAGGTAFDTRRLGLQSFSLGGPFRLGAYGVNELLGNQFFFGQGGYEHKLLSLSPLVGEGVYLVGAYEIGKVYGNPVAPHLPMDGSAAVVAKTVLGPVYFGGSATHGRAKWWFGVGRIF